MSDFNGIDISNPTLVFTNKEWNALGPGGEQSRVTHQCMIIHRSGCGHNAGKIGQGCGIAAVETRTEQEYVDEADSREVRGGRNGVRFGSSGYRP